MNAEDEMVEVVDENGSVTGIVTRAEMRASGLRHRSTYIAVVRPDNRLVIHRRANWKDTNPGYWDIAFGGVAGVGETWRMAAERELAEEAGLVDVKLIDVGRSSYDADDGHIVAALFLVRTEKHIAPVDGEVTEIGEIPLHELSTWARSRDVCDDSMTLMAPILRKLGAAVPPGAVHHHGGSPTQHSTRSTESPSRDCSKDSNT